MGFVIDVDSGFQTALIRWRDISFGALQKQLDSQAEQIIANQSDSLLERKELSTKTREFRKLPDDEKITQVRGLLKAYQTAIDALTTRSKTVETSFLSAYKLLGEAPDPYPLLEATIDHLVAAQESSRILEENQRLRAQLRRQEDADQLLRRLERAEAQTEERLRLMETTKDKQWTAVLDERERSWNDREEELQQQISELREMTKDLQIAAEVASAQKTAQSENPSDAGALQRRRSEFDFISSELERTSYRLADAERRNEGLRKEIVGLESGQSTSDKDHTDTLQREVRTLEEENENARRKLIRITEDGRLEIEALQRTQLQLERETSLLREDSDGLRKKVQSRNDYEVIKAELEMMKKVSGV